MITVNIDADGALRLLGNANKQIRRSLEIAIDKTADLTRDAIKAYMPKVFDRPTPYTLNSLKVEHTKNHNLTAAVWFKEPDRMGEHYLVPQVEGGKRKLKGFERALGGNPFVPSSRNQKLDRYGNLPYGLIVQMLSVLGRAEYLSGYSANITERSKKRNRRPRDYVFLPRGAGKLPPGVYRRVQTGAGFGYKTKKFLPFGEWQKGRTRGRFSSVVYAKGLQSVVVQGKTLQVQPRLPFYQIANKTISVNFNKQFAAAFAAQSK